VWLINRTLPQTMTYASGAFGRSRGNVAFARFFAAEDDISRRCRFDLSVNTAAATVSAKIRFL
jgi:hypothetical protein